MSIIIEKFEIVAPHGEANVVFVVHEAELDPPGPLYGLPRGVRTHGVSQSAQQTESETAVGRNTLKNRWRQANSVAK